MKLMHLFEFMPKSKFSASYGSDKGNYPFFTSSNTIDKYCDDFIYDGEFLIIGDGGTGNCKHYNGKFSVSDHNYVLKPKSQTNALAVKYFLEKDNYQILNDGFKGIGIKNVSKSYIQNIEYKYNQHFSQNEIVKNLVLIEKNIEREKQSINSLDCLIKSRFNEMFSDFKAIKTIGDFSYICRGASPRPISNFITKGIGENWIKIGDVGENDIYITETAEKVTKNGADKSRRVKPGDFILSNSMSFGRPYILGINGCVHDGWLIISDYQNTFESLFFYYLLRSNDVQAQFDGSAYGATVRNLNSNTVRKVKVITPPLSLQGEFVSFVTLIDKLKFNCQQRIKLYQELLDKKMDEYFG